MWEHGCGICPVCGDPVDHINRNGASKVYCSKRCQRKMTKRRRRYQPYTVAELSDRGLGVFIKVCVDCGCELIGRGTHNRCHDCFDAYQLDGLPNPDPKPKKTHTCDECGDECESRGLCSDRCRDIRDTRNSARKWTHVACGKCRVCGKFFVRRSESPNPKGTYCGGSCCEKRREILAKHRATRVKRTRKPGTYYDRNRDRLLSASKTPIKRLKSSIRKRIRDFMVGIRCEESDKWLGCSWLFFRDYIESKFSHGMTWDNYGEWHLDHVIPLASFDLTDKKQVLAACHYTNISPLWATQNIRKGRKIVGCQPELLLHLTA